MAHKPFRLAVVTPEAALADLADVAWVQVPLADGGSVGIFPGHAPLLAETRRGPLRYATLAGEQAALELEAGILEVERDRVTVFTTGRLPAHRVPPDASAQRFDRLAEALLAGLGADPSAAWEGVDGGETERAPWA